MFHPHSSAKLVDYLENGTVSYVELSTVNRTYLSWKSVHCLLTVGPSFMLGPPQIHWWPVRLFVERTDVFGTARSRKVPKPRDWGRNFSNRFEIWHVHRQRCCRGACQITGPYDHYNIQSRSFETSRYFGGKTSVSLVNTGPSSGNISIPALS